MGVEEDVASLRLDIDELKQLEKSAQRPKVQSILLVELRRMETKLAELLEVKGGSGSGGGATAAAGGQRSAIGSKVFDIPYKNYAWDESDKFVKIYLSNLKNVQTLSEGSGFEKTFAEKSLNFKVLNLEGRNHILDIAELAGKVDPAKSYFKVKQDLVVIFLAKAVPGKKWGFVTAAEKAAHDKKNAPPKFDDGGDDDKDPTKGIMSMMKKMYDEGDDDMKRTIAKAWTESQNKSKDGGPESFMDL